MIERSNLTRFDPQVKASVVPYTDEASSPEEEMIIFFFCPKVTMFILTE